LKECARNPTNWNCEDPWKNNWVVCGLTGGAGRVLPLEAQQKLEQKSKLFSAGDFFTGQ